MTASFSSQVAERTVKQESYVNLYNMEALVKPINVTSKNKPL